MRINSTRFGTFEVRDDAILTFPDGLIGLPGTRYVLVAQEAQLPFCWLQSAEHDHLAVPVTNPWTFFPDYEIRVNDDEARRLELSSPDQAEIVCVVRASESLEDFTVNLTAPVLIHRDRRIGRQIINDAHGYSVRHRLFSEVELDAALPEASSVSVQATAI
jgi:flagellar assembly factor FliW